MTPLTVHRRCVAGNTYHFHVTITAYYGTNLTTTCRREYQVATMLRTYVRRGKRGQEVKEDLARVQGETTGGG
jgi:hypothetical protein